MDEAGHTTQQTHEGAGTPTEAVPSALPEDPAYEDEAAASERAEGKRFGEPPLGEEPDGSERPEEPEERGEYEEEPAEEPVSIGRWLLELVVLVALAFALATGIKTYIVQPFVIPSLSMAETLEIGDRVLVNKFVYRYAEPQPGDIVVFLSPTSSQTDYIKRVIAVGGQTVDIKRGFVSIDGVPLREPYVLPAARDEYSLPEPVKIPEGQVWLMGDNRANSSDSRFFGPQPVSRVIGRAFAIYWPPNRATLFH